MLQWVPAGLTVRLWPTRVQGGIGADAEGGYIAFNIANFDDVGTYVYASYLIVMDLRGQIAAVEVIEQATAAYGKMHFDALKLMDPSHLLLGANTDPLEESGPAYLYDWRAGAWDELANGISEIHSSHDVQWEPAPSGNASHAAIWRPVSSGFYLQDTVTGDTLESYVAPPEVFDDVNHAQIVVEGGERYAIVSSRETDSFSKEHARAARL